MFKHLFDAGSVVGIEGEHLGHEILEFLREELHAIGLALAVGLPEYVSSIGGQASVEGIAWLGSGEWWMLGNHNEQHYGSGEQVHLLSLIWLLKMNLWSHVIHSSKIGLELSTSISSFNWSCETKVCNLNTKVLIKEQIFWFDISMANSITMAVLKTSHKLSEEISCKRLIEPS